MSKNDATAQLPRTLAVDIGGTGIKAMVLDASGKPLTERSRIETPSEARPAQVLAIIAELAKKLGEFERVSVGFPGVTKHGLIYTAPNLGQGWPRFPLEARLARSLGRPVRVANDADVQGLGAVSGQGVELVITLGTGVGSVIFVEGHRLHLELGHHPFRKGRTYEDELGIRALKKRGKRRWNKRLAEAIAQLGQVFNYDRLFLGGGNTKHIDLKLPAGVQTIRNEQGLLGGIGLWKEL